MENLLEEININVRFVNFLKNVSDGNHIAPWRKLYDFEMVFVTKGEVLVKTKTESFTVRENQLHIMPPNVYYMRVFSSKAPCDFFSAHLDFFSLPKSEEFSFDEIYGKQLEDENYKTPNRLKRRGLFENIGVPSVIDIKNGETFAETFMKLLTAYYKKDSFKNVLFKQYGYELLYQILNECKEQDVTLFSYKKNPHIHIVNEYVALVDSQFSNEIDLSKFTREYGISKNYFSLIFKRQFNVNPHEYLMNKRIEESKKLLKSGEYSVTKIARMVGYEDISYFSRLFKIKVGVSPLKYLKS